MITNNKTIQTTNIKTVRAAFKSYKHAQQPIVDHAAVVDAGSFQCHALRVTELLNILVDIDMVWGSDKVNFHQLTQVFKVYSAYRPHECADTLALFSTLFELIASILEHRDHVYTLSKQYEFINNELDQMVDGRDFKEVIFPEFYNTHPPIVN